LARADIYQSLCGISAEGGLGFYDLEHVMRQCSISLRDVGRAVPGLADQVWSNVCETLNSGPSGAKNLIVRVCRGPETKVHDGRWRFARQDEPLTRMPKIEYKAGLLQKLHHTAFRETVASEIPALNILEFQGLPWGFYIDMMRQCEDEARHSLMAAHELQERGGDFGMFKLPYLRSYYEMFWDMGLTERLVALNIDIEAVGAPHLGDMARRMEVVGDRSAARLFECLHHDEKRHARIGSVWLKHLYPSAAARRAAIDACRALTTVNLASASSRITGQPFWDTFHRWASDSPIYSYDQPLSSEHEVEVTPLLARVKGEISVHAVGI
jgi:uncharacterized ferritin-like protein (DUF455 family)